MLAHASSLISWQCLPVRPAAGLQAQLGMQNELLPGNSNPVKHLQYELGVSREQKNKQLCGGDEVSERFKQDVEYKCPDCEIVKQCNESLPQFY